MLESVELFGMGSVPSRYSHDTIGKEFGKTKRTSSLIISQKFHIRFTFPSSSDAILALFEEK